MTETCTADCSVPFVQTQAVVTHQERVSSRYLLLRLRCESIARTALPGQFVMIACAQDIGGISEPLLPRPLAILDARGDEIELLYFVSGYGTSILRQSGSQTGTPLRIIGPLGRGFEPIPGVDVHIALGGGSGVAPLVFFYRRFAKSQKNWHLVLAARSSDQLAREDVVACPGRLHKATDDGSAGVRGTAIDAMNSLLSGELKGAKAGIYAAGPEPMMMAAAKQSRALNLPCMVSLEQRMACGVGVCRACVVDGVSPHKKTGLLRRTVCQDGPVFDINELAGW
ncbi:MAG TPA: dihydroorotate dehydrogenase electron transfer subunit [Planctomycetota bacterium]|nr:dihydroorotate dehydrogenase electron transfer subunit [Planctomycetota bacterium]